jgi:uncharacterized protein (DUF1778 family)
MNESSNNARVTARIPVTVKETLQKAADLSGATLNQFLIQAAIKEAHQILEAERSIVISERDAQTIFELLENPPEPNEKLTAAINKHKAFFAL